MTNSKCKNCGCSEIDVDPSRGDAVCTNCGVVLEDSIIVSEVQFEENAHGGGSAIGQFVSSESSGGITSFGGSFHTGLGKESREITLKNAKNAISNLAQQLRLNQHCVETAFNFYKMALTRHLTRGRKNSHVVASCVYMTCRIEGTSHLLIDFSDHLQICIYSLGRTYLRLSRELCISVPSMDPCMYVLRFANKLDFGDKTHEVSMTALRLVQRMKRDFIHTGRRPSGLCGAALLIAARFHEFNRTVKDIIKIVKVHDSTLKKRLKEFGETPSSSLSFEEFFTVDLEEEQDPPAFKMARKKDKEKLLKLMEEEDVDGDLLSLRKEIEQQLFDTMPGTKSSRGKRTILSDSDSESDVDTQEVNQFTDQSTIGVIHECLNGRNDDDIIIVEEDPLAVNEVPEAGEDNSSATKGLGPDIASMGLVSSMQEQTAAPADQGTSAAQGQGTGELSLDGIDDAEIDSYIMRSSEASFKDSCWMKINQTYLKEKKEREEKKAKEKEEGKPEKKRRKTGPRKKFNQPSNSAGEAIEKMLQEKKISSKINYDVLKSLNVKSLEVSKTKEPDANETFGSSPQKESVSLTEKEPRRIQEDPAEPVAKPTRAVRSAPNLGRERKRPREVGFPLQAPEEAEEKAAEPEVQEAPPPADFEEGDDYDEDDGGGVEAETTELSVAQMLKRHTGDDDEDYGGYDYDDY
ncbi:transcription factor IIIB 90 kDa subunit [Bacillus rossius redtenbacheri]|uniref:transcription factor IIIB 90 kDa subunit n=1 Tax=Bacillus rossius redtenbacheri TaxID=93214 RepID=UPI002FDCBE04